MVCIDLKVDTYFFIVSNKIIFTFWQLNNKVRLYEKWNWLKQIKLESNGYINNKVNKINISTVVDINEVDTDFTKEMLDFISTLTEGK